MDPLSLLAIASLVGTLASTGYSMYASNEQKKQAEINAEHNARLQEQAAREEKERRAIEARNERDQSKSKIASMEARYAKAGLLMTGTPTEMVRSQVHRLPPKWAMALSLHHFDDLSYDEIADAMKIPRPTVATYIFRARKQIARQIITIMGKETYQGNRGDHNGL